MLSQMFGLSASICMEILKENGFEVDRAVDEILTMKYVNSSTIRAPSKAKQVEEDEQLRALQLEAKSQKDRQERLLNAHKPPQPDDNKPQQDPPKPTPSRDRDILYDSVHLAYAKNFLAQKKAEEAEKNRLRNEEELRRQQAEIQRLRELEKENDLKKREAARVMAEEAQATYEAKRRIAETEKEKMELEAKLAKAEKEKQALLAELEAQKKLAELEADEKKKEESDDDVEEIVRAVKDYLHQSLALVAGLSQEISAPEPEPEYLMQAKRDHSFDVQSQLASIGHKAIPSNENVPLIQLHHDSNTPQETMKKVFSLLGKIGVESSEVRSLDISEDFEMKGFLKSQHHSNELQLPYLFLKTQPLGSYDELTAFERPKLKECVEKARKGEDFNPRDFLVPSEGSTRPQMGYFDSALGGVETLLSYLNPFSYFRGNCNGELLSGDNIFDVLHTNWYGRHLERKFKFLDTTFLRIHAKYGDIRAARPYTDISLVRKKSPTFLAIEYANGSSPDWLQGAEKDITSIIHILKSKASHAKFVDASHEE